MAVSKVGLGWPVGERDFDTLIEFLNAMGSTGQFETANCLGDLGSTDTLYQTGAFGSGLLITSDVKYTGNNHQDLPYFDGRLYFTNTSSITIEHIAHYNSTTGYSLRLIRAGSTVRDCYAKKLAVDSTAPMYDVGTAATAERLVVDANNLAAATVQNTSSGLTSSITGLNATNRGIRVPISGGVGYVQNSLSLGSDVSDYFWSGDASSNDRLINSASESTGDYSGNFTGYTTDEFVDFASGDYRIKTTSDLFALGIGAFFEEAGTDVDSTVAATWPLFQTQASQSSTAPDITSDISAQWPVFGVSVSQGAQAPDVESTIAAAWPLFTVQTNQASQLPQYQATIATTWPMFSASVSQQSEVPQYNSDLAAAWPLFTVGANQESQLPEGATSIAVTWPLFGVDAIQQSTVPEFDSTIAATWPLFQVSASQQQELPSGATAIAIEWPLFGVHTSQESTIPEFTATVAATWPLFSVSILAGEFEFFASPRARVDIPNLSRRVDTPSLSRRIDI